jgi:hypothetical protein
MQRQSTQAHIHTGFRECKRRQHGFGYVHTVNNSHHAANVSLQTPANGSSPFSADPSEALPAIVAPGSTLTFKLNFSPAANGVSTVIPLTARTR